MVQKWAIGAMINVSGSIAINLGTNLMKLSHKVRAQMSYTVCNNILVLLLLLPTTVLSVQRGSSL